MKYELWKTIDEKVTSLSFICVDAENYQQSINLLEPNSKLIWITNANTHNEAMQKYYDLMNWGKYKPIIDE